MFGKKTLTHHTRVSFIIATCPHLNMLFIRSLGNTCNCIAFLNLTTFQKQIFLNLVNLVNLWDVSF